MEKRSRGECEKSHVTGIIPRLDDRNPQWLSPYVAFQKTILITGGAGFIGSNFAHYMRKKYPQYRLIILDLLTYAGSLDNLPELDEIRRGHNALESESVQFWYGNIRNAELVDTLVSHADFVVNFAAETHVTRSIFDDQVFFETDVLGTQTVASAIVKNLKTVDRFIHISTSEVYGTAVTEPMDENHPLLPLNPYAAAKAGGDRLVYSYWATHQIPAVIVRPFNNFGPRQHLEKMIPRFVTSCLLNESLNIHGDGSYARDWTYVEDTCRAIDLILHADKARVIGEVFNIASGMARSVDEIANEVLKRMDRAPSLKQHIGDRPGQVAKHIGTAEKMTKVLGWKPQVTFSEGLDLTIEWYRKNPEWWKKQVFMRSIPIVTRAGIREFH